MDRDNGALTVDGYITAFPQEVRDKLCEMRRIIREAAPDAEEKISYRMPAYVLNGPLVYFAAFTRHIGFYPTAEGMVAFQNELAGYKTGKGSVQFPMDLPLPESLIAEMVRSRAHENRKRKKQRP